MSTDIQRTIEAVWRIESTKVTAAISRLVRDVGLAEELAQDAFVAALEQWPQTGIPDRPAAWLMRTARNKAVDRIRRNVTYENKQAMLARDAELGSVDDPDWDRALDDPVGDDILRLMFIACHPVLSMEARVALTLRLLGGLTTAEIARAFLAPKPTIAQRIVRAKRTLAREQIPFETPPPDELAERLSSVLEVIYLIFNEGYTATSGQYWLRADLCMEALRLGRILVGLAPEESEAHGLLALMEIQASRFRTRIDADGNPVRLPDQDRRRWDRLHIKRGLAALDRARDLAPEPGFYLLQAEIAACHARAHTFEETDWKEIVRLYDELAARYPSPVVELNRAVAVGMAEGPEAGLELVGALATEPLLEDSHLLASVRADLLEKAGRLEEARAEFTRAAQLTQNEAERQLLTARAESL
ncbi:MAG TPA: RNA polymerase sigma factor [Acidimicrobiia bacterium]